jgi:hypothetical protein
MALALTAVLICWVAQPAAAAQPQVTGRVAQSDRLAAPPPWLKSLARLFVQWKEEHGEVAGEVGKELLKEWLKNEKCSNLLPAPYFCPSASSPTALWGRGYALTWRGKREAVWNSPTSPRSVVYRNGIVYVLTPGTLYLLTCYARGDTASDGGISTNLWYRLPSGGWVNDGWVQTGTNSVIPGVAHC